MTTHHVVTTLNKPTAVTCAVKVRFINSKTESLIICKGSSLEFYSIEANGVSFLSEFTLYGVISKVEPFLLPDKDTFSLFVLTDEIYYTILSYDPVNNSIKSEGSGILEYINARLSDLPISTVIDTDSSTILVSAFTGTLFAIPFGKNDTKGKSKEPRQPRLEPAPIPTHEFDFISMAGLKGVSQSQVAVLLGEINELKTIKVFKYSAGTNDFVENEKLTIKVESTTHTLIAVPNPIGGILAIGEYIISYHSMNSTSNTSKEVSIDPVLVTAYTFFNNSYDKCILGDSDGHLYMLSLEISNMTVTSISSLIIGQVSYPTSIVDLGNNLLYIGSSQGDPCIVRLIQDTPTGKYSLQTIISFSNLGPIVDFCLFDYDQQGKKTMVCCSGVDKNGSLRIVENGIGFLEKFNLNLPLVNNVWSVNNDTFIISTCYETMALKQISPTEMREVTQHTALTSNEPTLALTSTPEGMVIQVTASCLKMLVLGNPGRIVQEWRPPQNQKIATATVNPSQCVLSFGNGKLAHFDCRSSTLKQLCIIEFPDISCIYLSGNLKTEFGDEYVLVSTWKDPTVYFLQLPDLKVVYEKKLQTVSPRDVLLLELEKKCYLMVLLGDGQLLSYVVNRTPNTDKLSLTDEKQTMVGTYSTGLHPYIHQGRLKLFITGSRPTVVTSFNQTLYFSTVNFKDIFGFTKHNDSIILMTENGLLFGQLDANQKLHHTKIKLESGMPSRIQYMKLSKTLAIGTVLTEKDLNNGFNLRKGKIQLLDAQTFQILDTYDFPGIDLVESMTSTSFSAYPNQEYLFVGTVVEDKEDPDSSTGHIFVFEIKDSRIELIETVEKPGIIYDMKPLHNSVVACVNGSIYCMNKFRPDLPMGERVSFELNVHKNILALSLDTRGDRVLVGDLMRSLSLLTATSKDPLQLELKATDTKPSWTTAVKFINDDVFMGADDRNNLYTLAFEEHNNTSIPKLVLKGGFHVGSLINCIRDDTLTDISSSEQKEDNVLVKPLEKSFTFATLHGSIGTVKTISVESFQFFSMIQDSILDEIQNIGNLDYHVWRRYKPKMNTPGIENQMFLDGDILKQFLSMSESSKQKVLASLAQYSAADIENLINSLISLHE